jgi:hypothetical protein
MKTKKKGVKTLSKRQRNDRDSMPINKNKKQVEFETAESSIEKHFSTNDWSPVKKSKGADEEG